VTEVATSTATPAPADPRHPGDGHGASAPASNNREALFAPAWARRTLVAVTLFLLVFPLPLAAFPAWVWVLGLLALYAPTPSLLFAFGASLSAVAFLLIPALRFSPAGALVPTGIWLAMMCGFLGGPFILWLAARAERSESKSSAGVALLGVGAVALASLAPFLRYTNALEINEATRVRPTAGAVLVGFSALLLTTRSRAARVLAFLLAIVAISPVVFATEGFRHRFAKDPLLANHTTVDWREPQAALATWHIRDQFQTLELSPSGTALIGGLSPSGFVVFGPGPQERRYPAVRLRFASEDHVVGIFAGRNGLELREYDTAAQLGEGQPTSRLPLPSLQGMALDVDPDARTWRVSAPLGAASKVFSGVLGTERVDEETWGPERVAQDQRSRATVRGASDLIVRSVGRPPRSPEHEGWDEPMPEHNPDWNTELWFTDDTGRAVLPVAKSRLGLTCERPPHGQAASLCVAHDKWESYVWLFGRSGSTVTQSPVLTVDGRIVIKVGPDGTFLAKTYRDVEWVDPNRHLGVRFPYPRRPDHLYTGPEIVALGSRKLALVDEPQATVSVYALP